MHDHDDDAPLVVAAAPNSGGGRVAEPCSSLRMLAVLAALAVVVAPRLPWLAEGEMSGEAETLQEEEEEAIEGSAAMSTDR